MSYWISFNRCSGLLEANSDKCFMITVAIDRGLRGQLNLNGVRVVICSPESLRSDLLPDLVIQECRDSWTIGSTANASASPGIRNRLLEHRRRTKLHPAMMEKSQISYCSDHSGVTLEVLVVAERADKGLGVIGFGIEQEADAQAFLARGGVLLYQTLLPIASLEEGALVLMFDCSHDIDNPDNYDNSATECSMGIPSYNIHILRTHRTSHKSPHPLPQDIIQRIVTHAANTTYPRDWEKMVLSCALVAKSWQFATRVFFENFCSNENLIQNPIGTARSLELRPEMGKLIKKFHLANIAFLSDKRYSHRSSNYDPYDEESTLAYKKILLLAPRLEYLSLSDSMFSKAVSILKNLSMVAEFSLFMDTMAPEKSGYTILDVYDVICHWPQLRSLDISSWELSSETEKSSQLTTRSLCSTLRSLTLAEGHLPGAHLTKLSSPRLVSLQLFQVLGLSNGHLKLFLTTASESLEDIIIQESTIDKLGVGEEYAFDAAIHLLQRLTSLEIDGSFVTPLCIARKTPSKDENGNDNHACIYISELPRATWKSSEQDRKAPSVGGTENEGIVCVNLADAIKNTGWNEIYLNAGGEWEDLRHWGLAQKVAKGRRIKLKIGGLE